MGDLKPSDEVPPWKHRVAEDRVWRCMQLLYLEGFLTNAEYDRVRARIFRWKLKHTQATGPGKEMP